MTSLGRMTPRAQRLTRETFKISRELEFLTEKELGMQIGHGRPWWPVALVKELIDNALDACESADVAPEVGVQVTDAGFSVADNGPGLPAEVISRSLDFMQRVSDKALYVAPTRGQLGNALKTVWAAPYVAHGQGRVEIETGEQRHVVEVTLDEIAQRPRVIHTIEAMAVVRNGTRVWVAWPDSGCPDDDDEDPDSYNSPPTVQELVEAYAALNAHAAFRYRGLTYAATQPGCRKWRASDPTSPHWYSPETLGSLIAGYLLREREGGRARTVREFVSEFRGLSSTLKQKQVTEGLSRLHLHDLVKHDALDASIVAALLQRMQALSKPVKPQTLGVIGEEHLAAWMVAHADVAADSVKYARRLGEDDGLPFVVEMAFGIRQGDREGRRAIYGLNWAPALGTPVPQLSGLMQQMRMDPHDPITVVLHLAKPRLDFTDHGKTRVHL